MPIEITVPNIPDIVITPVAEDGVELNIYNGVQLSSTAPSNLGATAAVGASAYAARSDHVHLDPVIAHVAAADPHTQYIQGATGLVNAGRLLKVGPAKTAAESAMAEGSITGILTLAKTGTTARTATFQDYAYTVAGIDIAQTFTQDQTFGKILPSYVQFAIAATDPTHSEGMAYWNATDHTLNLMSEINGSTLQIGQENWIRIVNKTGAQLNDGQVVYLSGAQGNRPTASLAQANSSAVDKTIGVCTADINNNAEGYVTSFGILRGINTTGFSAGDVLYVSATTAGALTNTAPSSPNHAVRVGYALNSTVNGSIFVSPHAGSDLAGLHDVLLGTLANNDALRYSLSNARWENTTQNAWLDISQTFTAAQTIQAAGGITSLQAATQDAVRLLGRAGGTSSYVASITSTTLTDSRTFTLPDASITLAGSATALTSGRIPFVTTGGLLTDGTGFLNDGSTKVSVDYSTASTSTTSGALVVTGGLGIGGAIFGGGNLGVTGIAGIGGASNTAAVLSIGQASPLTGVSQVGALNSSTATTGATTAIRGFQNSATMAAGSYTTGEWTHFLGASMTVPSGVTVTTWQGVNIQAPTITGTVTNAYGIRSQIASASGRYNLYLDGTAANYLAGTVGVGVLPATNTALYVASTALTSTTQIGIASSFTASTGSTTQAIGFYSNIALAAGTWTCTATYGMQVAALTVPVNVTVSAGHGLDIITPTVNGTLTNYYGVRIRTAAATNRYCIFAEGTASNHLAGTTLIGTTTDHGKLSIKGGSAATTVDTDEAVISAGSVFTNRGRMTTEGGFAVLMTADEAIAVGEVCASIQGGTAGRVKRCPTTGNENDMPIGVAYTAAAGAGSTFWMVTTGRVAVKPDTGVTAAQGYIMTTSSTTAGLVAQAASAPAAATHFKEIGHFIATGSGAGVATDAIVHFN